MKAILHIQSCLLHGHRGKPHLLGALEALFLTIEMWVRDMLSQFQARPLKTCYESFQDFHGILKDGTATSIASRWHKHQIEVARVPDHYLNLDVAT